MSAYLEDIPAPLIKLASTQMVTSHARVNMDTLKCQTEVALVCY